MCFNEKLFAAAALGGYTVAEVGIAVVVIAAVIALVAVALREFKVAVPPWVIHVLVIVGVALLVIVAIKVVASL